MFSFLRKESRDLQLYGKLPIAKDYLRIGCSEGAARELREWADRVFSGAVEGAAPKLAGPLRFVVSSRGAAPLVGCTWPSSDAGGLRPFPFFALIERSKKGLVEEWRAGRIDHGGAWRSLEELWPRLQEFADGEQMLSKLRGTTIGDVEAPALEAERPGWRAWLAAIWGDDGATGLAETIARLDRLGGADKTALVRLPLASDMPLKPQVHGWWTLLCELGLARADETPTLFFPQDGAAVEGAAFVLFASQLPSDVRWLGPATPDAPLGPGDLALAAAPLPAHSEPALENEPPLSDSLRGALVLYRTRR